MCCRWCFGFIKDIRYANATTPDSFDRLPRQATGSFNRQSFDDVVSGKYEDFPFELYEANAVAEGREVETRPCSRAWSWRSKR